MASGPRDSPDYRPTRRESGAHGGVLSALDPVRVYQDFAQLGLLSHGRAEIIAGRSAFAEPFALFGAPINEYDALFTEKLDLLLRLREHDQLTWSGRYRPPLV